MPWKFTPVQKNVVVYPGQPALAFFKATNLSNEAITGISSYNVVPQQVKLP
jgi:cytochrome c oxidase assembly protein subunit 11